MTVNVIRLFALAINLWMARDLAYSMDESWCYQDTPLDCEQNGRLYTWSAALKACPEGCCLATDEDWILLASHLGMSSEDLQKTEPRGEDQRKKLRQREMSGFDAPISGYRRPSGEYVRRGERAAFWTATEANQEEAWHRDLRSEVATIYRSPANKAYALSVRCTKVVDSGK